VQGGVQCGGGGADGDSLAGADLAGDHAESVLVHAPGDAGHAGCSPTYLPFLVTGDLVNGGLVIEVRSSRGSCPGICPRICE